jgi:hypothetical protein
MLTLKLPNYPHMAPIEFTQADKAAFRDGYVVVRNFFTSEEIDLTES